MNGRAIAFLPLVSKRVSSLSHQVRLKCYPPASKDNTSSMNLQFARDKLLQLSSTVELSQTGLMDLSGKTYTRHTNADTS